jgi:hypothetical protein
VPQARAQPLDQARPALGFGGRVAEHADAPAVQRHEIARFETDRFDGLNQLKTF